MDLTDYYKQAKIWKKSRDELELEAKAEKQQKLAGIWDAAKEAIRKVFPIQGAKLYETEPHQTDDEPQVGGNYPFDLVLPGCGKGYAPIYGEERTMKGVIRVVVNCASLDPHVFRVIRFYVWEDGHHPQQFENHYEAFLACIGETGTIFKITE